MVCARYPCVRVCVLVCVLRLLQQGTWDTPLMQFKSCSCRDKACGLQGAGCTNAYECMCVAWLRDVPGPQCVMQYWACKSWDKRTGLDLRPPLGSLKPHACHLQFCSLEGNNHTRCTFIPPSFEDVCKRSQS